jgi:tetratricopeptide (TPR) repeat protein
LEGTIQQAEGRLRLSVHLLRVADGTSLWAETFDTRLSDMFGVQDAISSQVTQALSLHLSREERDRLRKRYTENAEAYQAYLKGRYLWSKRTDDALRGAIVHFEEAIRIDPNYALAYSGLADCYHMNALYSDASTEDMYAKATAAAKKALELDDSLAEAHSSLADIKHEFEWDFPGAAREYQRALELNPNYPTARQWYAQFLSNMGQHEEAIAEIKRAVTLDPTALVISGAAGDIYSNAGQHDQALQHLQKTLEIDPNYALTYAFMARVFERKGMFSQALDALEKGWTIDYSENKLKVVAARREAFRRIGERGYWQKLLEMETTWGGLDAFTKAQIYAQLGQTERALVWLERASQERAPGMARVKIEPAFNRLRADTRFKDLLRRVGFEP